MAKMRKNDYFFVLMLVMPICILHCAGNSENNVSLKETNADTCGADGLDCSQQAVSNSAAVGQWKPFHYKTEDKWVSMEAIFPAYVKWHNHTVHDSSIPCQEKRAVVFTPNAGLGDSIGALTSAFISTVKAGRLFFIDWKPYEWTVGLKALPFMYEYSIANSLRDPSSGKRLICVDTSRDESSFLSGHITTQHALLKDPVINDLFFPNEPLLDTLLQPSPKVSHIISDVLSSRLTKSVGEEEGIVVRLVALVIRTGEGEYNQFLSKGDERNFVKCFINYARNYANRASSRVTFRVFVTSDSDAVKQKVTEELAMLEEVNFSVDVVTLNDSIVHVMHVDEEDKRKKSIRDKIRKTYAEYFLIGRCQVLFLTHGSLFGRAAADRSGARESDIHYISDSMCDGKREKYSYLQCHEPKYPPVCGLS